MLLYSLCAAVIFVHVCQQECLYKLVSADNPTGLPLISAKQAHTRNVHESRWKAALAVMQQIRDEGGSIVTLY